METTSHWCPIEISPYGILTEEKFPWNSVKVKPERNLLTVKPQRCPTVHWNQDEDLKMGTLDHSMTIKSKESFPGEKSHSNSLAVEYAENFGEVMRVQTLDSSVAMNYYERPFRIELSEDHIAARSEIRAESAKTKIGITTVKSHWSPEEDVKNLDLSTYAAVKPQGSEFMLSPEKFSKDLKNLNVSTPEEVNSNLFLPVVNSQWGLGNCDSQDVNREGRLLCNLENNESIIGSPAVIRSFCYPMLDLLPRSFSEDQMTSKIQSPSEVEFYGRSTDSKPEEESEAHFSGETFLAVKPEQYLEYDMQMSNLYCFAMDSPPCSLTSLPPQEELHHLNIDTPVAMNTQERLAKTEYHWRTTETLTQTDPLAVKCENSLSNVASENSPVTIKPFMNTKYHLRKSCIDVSTGVRFHHSPIEIRTETQPKGVKAQGFALTNQEYPSMELMRETDSAATETQEIPIDLQYHSRPKYGKENLKLCNSLTNEFQGNLVDVQSIMNSLPIEDYETTPSGKSYNGPAEIRPHNRCSIMLHEDCIGEDLEISDWENQIKHPISLVGVDPDVRLDESLETLTFQKIPENNLQEPNFICYIDPWIHGNPVPDVSHVISENELEYVELHSSADIQPSCSSEGLGTMINSSQLGTHASPLTVRSCNRLTRVRYEDIFSDDLNNSNRDNLVLMRPCGSLAEIKSQGNIESDIPQGNAVKVIPERSVNENLQQKLSEVNCTEYLASTTSSEENLNIAKIPYNPLEVRQLQSPAEVNSEGISVVNDLKDIEKLHNVIKMNDHKKAIRCHNIPVEVNPEGDLFKCRAPSSGTIIIPAEIQDNEQSSQVRPTGSHEAFTPQGTVPVTTMGNPEESSKATINISIQVILPSEATTEENFLKIQPKQNLTEELELSVINKPPGRINGNPQPVKPCVNPTNVRPTVSTLPPSSHDNSILEPYVKCSEEVPLENTIRYPVTIGLCNSPIKDKPQQSAIALGLQNNSRKGQTSNFIKPDSGTSHESFLDITSERDFTIFRCQECTEDLEMPNLANEETATVCQDDLSVQPKEAIRKKHLQTVEKVNQENCLTEVRPEENPAGTTLPLCHEKFASKSNLDTSSTVVSQVSDAALTVKGSGEELQSKANNLPVDANYGNKSAVQYQKNLNLNSSVANSCSGNFVGISRTLVPLGKSGKNLNITIKLHQTPNKSKPQIIITPKSNAVARNDQASSFEANLEENPAKVKSFLNCPQKANNSNVYGMEEDNQNKHCVLSSMDVTTGVDSEIPNLNHSVDTSFNQSQTDINLKDTPAANTSPMCHTEDRNQRTPNTLKLQEYFVTMKPEDGTNSSTLSESLSEFNSQSSLSAVTDESISSENQSILILPNLATGNQQASATLGTSDKFHKQDLSPKALKPEVSPLGDTSLQNPGLPTTERGLAADTPQWGSAEELKKLNLKDFLAAAIDQGSDNTITMDKTDGGLNNSSVISSIDVTPQGSSEMRKTVLNSPFARTSQDSLLEVSSEEGHKTIRSLENSGMQLNNSNIYGIDELQQNDTVNVQKPQGNVTEDIPNDGSDKSGLSNPEEVSFSENEVDINPEHIPGANTTQRSDITMRNNVSPTNLIPQQASTENKPETNPKGDIPINSAPAPTSERSTSAAIPQWSSDKELKKDNALPIKPATIPKEDMSLPNMDSFVNILERPKESINLMNSNITGFEAGKFQGSPFSVIITKENISTVGSFENSAKQLNGTVNKTQEEVSALETLQTIHINIVAETPLGSPTLNSSERSFDSLTPQWHNDGEQRKPNQNSLKAGSHQQSNVTGTQEGTSEEGRRTSIVIIFINDNSDLGNNLEELDPNSFLARYYKRRLAEVNFEEELEIFRSYGNFGHQLAILSINDVGEANQQDSDEAEGNLGKDISEDLSSTSILNTPEVIHLKASRAEIDLTHFLIVNIPQRRYIDYNYSENNPNFMPQARFMVDKSDVRHKGSALFGSPAVTVPEQVLGVGTAQRSSDEELKKPNLKNLEAVNHWGNILLVTLETSAGDFMKSTTNSSVNTTLNDTADLGESYPNSLIARTYQACPLQINSEEGLTRDKSHEDSEQQLDDSTINGVEVSQKEISGEKPEDNPQNSIPENDSLSNLKYLVDISHHQSQTNTRLKHSPVPTTSQVSHTEITDHKGPAELKSQDFEALEPESNPQAASLLASPSVFDFQSNLGATSPQWSSNTEVKLSHLKTILADSLQTPSATGSQVRSPGEDQRTSITQSPVDFTPEGSIDMGKLNINSHNEGKYQGSSLHISSEDHLAAVRSRRSSAQLLNRSTLLGLETEKLQETPEEILSTFDSSSSVLNIDEYTGLKRSQADINLSRISIVNTPQRSYTDVKLDQNNGKLMSQKSSMTSKLEVSAQGQIPFETSAENIASATSQQHSDEELKKSSQNDLGAVSHQQSAVTITSERTSREDKKQSLLITSIDTIPNRSNVLGRFDPNNFSQRKDMSYPSVVNFEESFRTISLHRNSGQQLDNSYKDGRAAVKTRSISVIDGPHENLIQDQSSSEMSFLTLMESISLKASHADVNLTRFLNMSQRNQIDTKLNESYTKFMPKESLIALDYHKESIISVATVFEASLDADTYDWNSDNEVKMSNLKRGKSVHQGSVTTLIAEKSTGDMKKSRVDSSASITGKRSADLRMLILNSPTANKYQGRPFASNSEEHLTRIRSHLSSIQQLNLSNLPDIAEVNQDKIVGDHEENLKNITSGHNLKMLDRMYPLMASISQTHVNVALKDAGEVSTPQVSHTELRQYKSFTIYKSAQFLTAGSKAGSSPQSSLGTISVIWSSEEDLKSSNLWQFTGASVQGSNVTLGPERSRESVRTTTMDSSTDDTTKGSIDLRKGHIMNSREQLNDFQLHILEEVKQEETSGAEMAQDSPKTDTLEKGLDMSNLNQPEGIRFNRSQADFLPKHVSAVNTPKQSSIRLDDIPMNLQPHKAPQPLKSEGCPSEGTSLAKPLAAETHRRLAAGTPQQNSDEELKKSNHSPEDVGFYENLIKVEPSQTTAAEQPQKNQMEITLNGSLTKINAECCTEAARHEENILGATLHGDPFVETSNKMHKSAAPLYNSKEGLMNENCLPKVASELHTRDVSSELSIGEVRPHLSFEELMTELNIGEVRSDLSFGEVIVEINIGEVRSDWSIGEVRFEVG
ncbi:hypothetical protein chiPu_0012255 [Chiloscyllium punctatum]|uniref:Uncharacterized protein n=1 Tax=Chiloscyllium punctatum TaxID=137246 RepID=A0A401STQ8_CHIPU|nr:hypothetical protein [Chiloscyllium punctatum]